jgi:DedD protein
LVGASVLVALAVIILPMLLGGGGEGPAESRQIEIPPRPAELDFEKRRFPIGEQATQQPSVVPEQAPGETTLSPGVSAENAPEPQPQSLQERLEAVAAANESQPARTPDDVPPVMAPGAEPADPLEADSTANDTAGQAPQQIPAAPVVEPEPVVQTAPEPEVAPPSQADAARELAARGRYVVQVASFSSTGNANRLAGSLRESGLPVIMDTVESAAGTLNRVRVGPYEQRAEAEQILARLNSRMPDVRPRLVDLRPDEQSPVTEPRDPLVRWVVQVGVFSSRENAEKLVFSLRDDGYRASSRSETADGVTRYKVLVGPEIERPAALGLRDRLLSEQGIKGIVQSSE